MTEVRTARQAEGMKVVTADLPLFLRAEEAIRRRGDPVVDVVVVGRPGQRVQLGAYGYDNSSGPIVRLGSDQHRVHLTGGDPRSGFRPFFDQVRAEREADEAERISSQLPADVIAMI